MEETNKEVATPQPTKEELLEKAYEEFKQSPQFAIYEDISEEKVKGIFVAGFTAGYDSEYFTHHKDELMRKISNALWLYADSYETPNKFEEKITISQISGFINEVLAIFSMNTLTDFSADAISGKASKIAEIKQIEGKKKQISGPVEELEEIKVTMLENERSVEEVDGQKRKFEIDMYKTMDYRIKNKLVVELSPGTTHQAKILSNGKAMIIS